MNQLLRTLLTLKGLASPYKPYLPWVNILLDRFLCMALNSPEVIDSFVCILPPPPPPPPSPSPLPSPPRPKAFLFDYALQAIASALPQAGVSWSHTVHGVRRAEKARFKRAHRFTEQKSNNPGDHAGGSSFQTFCHPVYLPMLGKNTKLEIINFLKHCHKEWSITASTALQMAPLL